MSSIISTLITLIFLPILLTIAACSTAPMITVEAPPADKLVIIEGEYNKFNQRVILKLPENIVLSGTVRKVPPMLIPEMDQVLLYSFVENKEKGAEGELLLTTADINLGSRAELRLSDNRKFIVDFQRIY
jgi:hypothetical protein